MRHWIGGLSLRSDTAWALVIKPDGEAAPRIAAAARPAAGEKLRVIAGSFSPAQAMSAASR
jgi:hypothetical protein